MSGFSCLVDIVHRSKQQIEKLTKQGISNSKPLDAFIKIITQDKEIDVETNNPDKYSKEQCENAILKVLRVSLEWFPILEDRKSPVFECVFEILQLIFKFTIEPFLHKDNCQLNLSLNDAKQLQSKFLITVKNNQNNNPNNNPNNNQNNNQQQQQQTSTSTSLFSRLIQLEIKSKAIQFPFKRFYEPQPQTLFQNLTRYEPLLSHQKFYPQNCRFMTRDFFPFTFGFENTQTLLLNEEQYYKQFDLLSDLFQVKMKRNE